MRKTSTRISFCLIACLLVLMNSAFAQVTISSGNTITQSFDGIGTAAVSTLPSGWKVDKQASARILGNYATAVSATERQGGANVSTTAANGIYNFGAGTTTAGGADRAIGGISSGSASGTVNVYVDLLNNGSLTIPGLTLSYDVEKYRGGTNAAGFRMQLFYSTDGVAWTNAGTDFLTAFAADASNAGYATAPGVSVSITSKLLPVTIAPNAHLYLAWSYAVSSGSTTSNAQGLSVDNISVIAATGVAPAPAITLASALPAFGSVKVGSGGSVKSFAISGSDLDGSAISVTALPGFSYSETGVSGTFTSTLSVAAGTSFTNKAIYVKFDPTAAQSYNGSIVVSGGNAANLFVPVTGSGNNITPVVISAQPLLRYTENFSDINNWSNNFNSGIGATRFSGVEISGTSSASNPTNDNPTLITTSSTTFVSGSAGGVQKASGAIQLISTGSTDNRSSVAVDFYMDFTGVNAGTLSFDWSVVNNSFAAGDSRTGSLQVYATTDGISFTRINAADVLNFVNGVPATGTVSSIQLPSFFNGSATARLRFFYYNGTGGASGSRPKISIDNLTVSGVANTPCATPTATPTSLTFGTITETTIQGNFLAASPSVNEYLVIMSSNSTLTSNPIDGVTYTVGDNIGDGDVISKGLDLNFTATGLTGATTYYFFVFPVNSVCTGGPKYLTNNVLTDDATTVAGLPPCAPPASQAADLVTSASINSIQGAFTATAADEYLVLQSTSASLSNTPINGIAYSVGAILGNATVIQKTAATSFTVSSLNPATQYYYFVFSVNSQNCVNGPVYNTVSPLSGSETTLPLPACTTPVSQPGSLSFNTSNNSITGTFNATGSGYNYLVVISNLSTLSASPSDNTDYAAGASLGGGTVISNNTTTSFIANNLSNSTTYYFFVFAANKNCTGGTKYLVASPLTGTATTTNAPVYNYYYGTLHSHSDYSDGNKDNPGFTPANNYAYADQSNGMDFLGISEHNHFSSLDNPGNELANYKLGVAQAAAYNAAHPGFLALYGMEWGVISGGGHVIVFGDGMNDLFGWESNVNGKVGPNYDVYVPKSTYLGTEGLFKTITNYAVNNAFATLAHPSNNDYNNLSNIAYDPIADEAISGTAVESGPATSTNTTYSNPGSSMFYLWYYQKLLSKGYHLGPTIDHDNHNTTFGRTTGARTAVLAPSLSQTDIIKSIKDMHFYATEDVDAKVDFTINTRIMGSIFEDRNAPSISVNFTDPTNSTSNALIRVLYGKPGSGILPVVVDSVFASSLTYVDNNLANNETGYYYVDITNGTSRIVTSPIWYTRKCASTSELTVSACDSYTWFGTVYTTSTTVSKVLTTTGGCDSTITLHLTINTSPSAATIALVGSDNGCPGTGVALTATAASTNAISTYQWLLNGTPVATTAVSNFTAFTSGSYAVTVTDINSCSVTSAGSISITVADNIAPITDVSILPVITAQCSATITTIPTATDNCAGTLTGTTTDALVYNEQGTYTIHWTYADGNGNTTLQEQTVIIKDDIAPVPNVAALPVITAACSATVTAPTAIDNCVGIITATTTDPVIYTTQGTFTIHWSYQDGHGNTATQNQTVIIQDVTAPVITKGADISVTNDPGTCGAVVLITAATSTDACGVATTIGVRSDAVSLSDLYSVGTTTITWTATDIHGNVSVATQTVTVIDNEKPVITAPMAYSVINKPGQCKATLPSIGTPVVNDNCGVASVTNNHPSSEYPVGTTIVIWTVMDIHGNVTDTARQSITVIDNEKPTITAPMAYSVINNPGQCKATLPSIGTPVVNDNCGVASVTNNHPSPDYAVGTTIVTWTVTDIHGNVTDTARQSITVIDNEKPTITAPLAYSVSNNPGECKATLSSIGTPVVNDNCGVASVTNNHPSSEYPVGTTIVTWVVIDIHGNRSVATQTITVIDNEKPTITAPMAYSVINNSGQCKATLPSIGTPVVNDNCGVASVTNNHPSPDYPVGTTIVTWMVTDIHGNVTDTARQSITVIDNEKPAITVNNVIVSSASGTCGATIILTTPVVSDNCGVASVTNNHPDTYYPVGTTLVTWTVTDNNGWTKTAIQSITVTDNTAPVISPLANQRFCLSGDGNYTIPVVTAEDNCSVASYSYSITGATIRNGNSNNASGLFNTGISTIIWTVTDASGNISVSSTIVTVDVLPSAVIVASTPDAFCNTVTLTASSAGVGSTYSWSTGSSNQSISLGQTSGDGVYSVTVTSNGCSSAPASYTFSKQTLVSSYTLLAFDEITLGENNKVNSGSVGVTSLKGEVSFRRNSSVSSPGSFVKAKKIEKNGSNIVISNPIYSAATGIALPTMLLNTASTHNLPNKDVSQNSVTTVNGNYKNLTLKKGSRTTVTGTVFGSIKVEQGAQVTFTAATISIDKLEVVKGPRYGYSYVRFAGDTKVLVSGSVSIGSQVYINPDNYKVTFYLGDKKSDDERFSVKGGDTKVTANIYVPNGKLKVTGGYSYGDYGNGRGDCDRDDDDDRYYGQGNSYVNMTGLFIADEIEGNGKNVIWNSFVCGSAAVPVLNATQVITQTLSEEKGTISTEAELKVTVLPNPSTTYFTLKLESRNNTAVNMRVTDSHGRVVDAKTGIGANSTLQVGHNFAAGIYYAEMIQGGVRKTVQLIKLR